MSDQFSRTELLFGNEALQKLHRSRVAVFGIGGVGGFAVEALARSGVGQLDLIDDDLVCLSNLNRQIIALHSTIGQYKVDVMQQRIHDINPDCIVRTYKTFYLPETAGQFDFTQYNYIIDAIDTVSGKLELAVQAQKVNVPIISSMGAGNKVDPAAFEVCDISKTSVCPLARVMRRELKKRGITHLKVVYSKEEALTPLAPDSPADSESSTHAQRRQTPGSNAFVPSVAGLILAGEVIKDLIGFENRKRGD